MVAISSAYPALPVPVLAEKALDEMGPGGSWRCTTSTGIPLQVTWLCGSRCFVQRHITREQRGICLQFVEHSQRNRADIKQEEGLA